MAKKKAKGSFGDKAIENPASYVYIYFFWQINKLKVKLKKVFMLSTYT